MTVTQETVFKFCKERAAALYSEQKDCEILVLNPFEGPGEPMTLTLITMARNTVAYSVEGSLLELAAPCLEAQQMHIALALFDYVSARSFPTEEHAKSFIHIEGSVY